MKNAFIAAIALAIATAALPAFAQESSEKILIAQTPTTAVTAPDAKQGFGKRFNLTDDQLEKLHAMKTSYKTANTAKRAELSNLRTQLKETLSAVNVDKSAALSIQSKINALQGELATSKVSFMADASTVFTPEQRQGMRKMMLRKDLMGGFSGHKRGHHGGGHFGKGGPGGPRHGK